MIDMLIVGGGPAGMSAAIYGARAGMSVTVLEKMPYGMGQITESHKIDNYLGLPAMNGFDMGMRFREHATMQGGTWVEGRAVDFLRDENGIWKTTLADGSVLESYSVVYCAGAAHRHLGIPGEEDFIGKGVSYCATCDGAFFKGKNVAIIGGGNTALHEALYLSEIANKVYLIHRRETFRGSYTLVEQIRQNENIELVMNQEPQEVFGEDTVTMLKLNDGRELAVDGIFVAVGMEPETEAVKNVIQCDAAGYVVADETGKTSASGFFVAGDVRTKALRQIITAVSDGANAATSAEHYVRELQF